MHTPPIFNDLLTILLVSVPVAFLCLRLKLPLLVGLMLTGMAIGPYGLRLVTRMEEIEVLAEIGVMLLLFTIGLEFSIKRLAEMKRLVLIGGGLQVIVTIIVVALAVTMWGRPTAQAILWGFLIALSSTAIVLKTYVDRKEVEAPHGRVAVAILLFQDISIVFMLLLIPLLGGGEGVNISSIALQLGGSLLALVVIVLAAWFLLPKFLGQIVKLRSPEVFLLTIVLFGLGMSWVTSHYGMSLALGGFIAGVVLADSDYSHQVTTEVLPFRDIFNSIFFVSIGLLLSISSLVANIGTVAMLVVGLIVGKSLIVWAIVRLIGFPQRVAAMAAIGLAQVGEFSFVLAKSGQATGLMTDHDYQIFLAASVISMIATPFLISAAPSIGIFVQRFLGDGPRGEIENVEEEDIHMTSSGGLMHHVIVVGYGLNGRNLTRVLGTVGIPYLVLDLDSETVRRARTSGEKINFGDATRREVLHHAHIFEASALVLAMSDARAARRTVRQARLMNKQLHIIVRTRYVSEITELLAIGADEVIPEEFETSIEIFARVLQRYGIARNIIEAQIDRIRKQGYEMLRTPSLPAPSNPIGLALEHANSQTVVISEGSPAAGKSLGELDLRGESGATVIAVIRNGQTKVTPGANYVLEMGDTVVLLGNQAKIERAQAIIEPEIATSAGFNP